MNGAKSMKRDGDLCSTVVRITEYGPTARGKPKVLGMRASRHFNKAERFGLRAAIAVPKFFRGGATAPCAKTVTAVRRTARLAAKGFFFNFKSLRTFARIFLGFTIADAGGK